MNTQTIKFCNMDETLKKKFVEHAENVKRIVKRWRNKFGVLECYFEIPKTRINCTSGKVCPTLGPSFIHANTWTVKDLESNQEGMYNSIKQYIIDNNLNDYEIEIFTTNRGSFNPIVFVSFIYTV